MNSDTTANNFTIPANGKIYFRGVNNNGWGNPNTNSYYNTITATGNHNVGGNSMSLLYGSDFDGKTSFPTTNKNVFYSLFRGNTTLVNSNELQLPATTLADNCYYSMFYNCSSLTTTPELPATKLTLSCYREMFYNCSLLTTAPELPATKLNNYCYSKMFYGCTNLTTAPSILPATTLSYQCYITMFQNCTSLITAPELPATTLAFQCYYGMFQNCTSLTTAPELPATTLADGCYSNMFSGTNVLPDCSNIDFTSETVVKSGGLKGLFASTKVTDEDLFNILPINPNTGNYYLPVTTLGNYCYYGMFQNCTSLTTAPELPATTLADSCYYYMFFGCSALTTAPSILPATTLANGCYQSMFWGCKALTTAPELPATTLANNCYQQMFAGCSKLNYIKANFINYSNTNGEFTNWVSGVSNTGTFVMDADANYNPEQIRGVNGIPKNWNIKKMTFKLAFENIDTDNINTLVIDNKNKNKLNLKYSLDKTNWIEIDNYPFTIEYDTKIGLSGTNITVDGLQIHCTNLYKLSGNITYLLNEEGDNLLPEDSVNTFKYLFVNDTNLTDISGLVFPENTVPNCYHHMFTGCSKLQSLPELPAIDLTKSCYHGMFMDCDELIKVSLPEAFLAPYAYSNMFLGSENLSDVTVTYNEDVDETNYKGWLDGVKSTGEFNYVNDSEVEENTIRNSYNVPGAWNISKTE